MKPEDMVETPKAQEGTWTLTAPDGRTWQDISPITVTAREMRERVPTEIRYKRMLRTVGAWVDEQPDYKGLDIFDGEDCFICPDCNMLTDTSHVCMTEAQLADRSEPKDAPEQSECEHKFVYPDGTPFCKYCGVYTNAITPPKGE